ncbi:hypothetical protein [Okeania sp. SIO2C2]|uniref:hypothetical protein n=1 Tax=Okeania sp. SIO2C2 TaxID=2607787 RepID=UPI00257A1307|nr:hypothetical protein [Okeania sp. SIO2C2]
MKKASGKRQVANMKNVSLVVLFEALFIPLVIIFIGSIAKKLARGKGWERQDLFWEIELTSG